MNNGWTERIKELEDEAINWAKIAGKNQAQIKKLADEVEHLKAELSDLTKKQQRTLDDWVRARGEIVRLKAETGLLRDRASEWMERPN